LKHFSEYDASNIIRAIIQGIDYCHSKDIVHRDLKPENMVFDESTNSDGQQNIVIIDFGEATIINENHKYADLVGTLYYMPPESIRIRRGYELKKSDMWSIGVITYVLVTGKAPFLGSTRQETLSKIIKAELSFPDNIVITNDCKDFIQSLIHWDCNKRFSAHDALQHSWLQPGASTRNLGDVYLRNIGDYCAANVLKKLFVKYVIEELTEDEKKIFDSRI